MTDETKVKNYMERYESLQVELTKRTGFVSFLDHTGGGCMANRFYVRDTPTRLTFVLTDIDGPWIISAYESDQEWQQGEWPLPNGMTVDALFDSSWDPSMRVVAATAVEWAKEREGMPS